MLVGSGRKLYFGQLRILGAELNVLWTARRAACASVGGALRSGAERSTGECGQPLRSTHTVPPADLLQ